MSKKILLLVTAEVPDETDPQDVRQLLNRLINNGLEEAADSLEFAEESFDNEEAEAATTYNWSSPQLYERDDVIDRLLATGNSLVLSPESGTIRYLDADGTLAEIIKPAFKTPSADCCLVLFEVPKPEKDENA